MRSLAANQAVILDPDTQSVLDDLASMLASLSASTNDEQEFDAKQFDRDMANIVDLGTVRAARAAPARPTAELYSFGKVTPAMAVKIGARFRTLIIGDVPLTILEPTSLIILEPTPAPLIILEPAKPEPECDGFPLIILEHRHPRETKARSKRSVTVARGLITPATPGPECLPLEATPSPSFRPSIDSSTTDSMTPINPKKKFEISAANDDRRLPAWRYSGTEAKAYAYIKALGPDAPKFTLNFGQELLDLIKANPKQAKKLVNLRIKRAFEKHRINADFLFGFDTADKTHRVHIHGSLSASNASFEEIEAALREAGGKWAAPRGKEHQAEVEQMTDNWPVYISRNEARTCKILGIKSILSISSGIEKEAPALWEAIREKQKAA